MTEEQAKEMLELLREINDTQEYLSQLDEGIWEVVDQIRKTNRLLRRLLQQK
jgi:hypothetical protein